ncbi:pyruvate kinase [Atopococcus tabaci]|uniref:pyruvate kinase n=1 Tax=Atopococcus tabaci TaxID=269774 RepID=UPI000421D8E3|nr:pyruvate kinase [Atopococcus tabaci]
MAREKKAKDPKALLKKMTELYDDVSSEGREIFKEWEPKIERDAFVDSAENLSYYLALRRRDIRGLQSELSPWGLSSLGRLEPKTLSNLEAVIATLGELADESSPMARPSYESFVEGQERLLQNAEDLFGKKPKKRSTRIMVTMPTEAAKDKQLVKDLIAKGMNVARINCAHDNPKIWTKMIENIRHAAGQKKKDVKILMDIAGPKIRIDWIFTTRKKPKVKPGDRFRLTRNYTDLPPNDEVKVTVGCSIPQIFQALKKGDPVSIDDGAVEGKVVSVTDEEAVVEVKHVNGSSIRIKAENGLNFPDTEFDIELLTEKDREDLAFACEHADIIGCSFIRDEEDIVQIQQEIHSILGDKAAGMALMAKIETVQAVENLPRILLTASAKNPFSVMIARGDLAVETGYIRLAELQQEILWICEAADIPVVWGTEVLDNMINTGIPTRAEVTDAAEGGRAECVMLNKGAYVVEAVDMLHQIFEKMQEHQYKKTPKLRALSIAKMEEE